MSISAPDRNERGGIADHTADSEEKDSARLLSAALLRISRLEEAVAELLVKNELLRQQAYRRD